MNAKSKREENKKGGTNPALKPIVYPAKTNPLNKVRANYKNKILKHEGYGKPPLCQSPAKGIPGV